MFTKFTLKRTEPHVAPRRTTDRAVSPVIGGILMFGLVMAMMVLVQVTGVPVWNAQEEFQHSQRVQEDFQDLDSAVASVVADGGTRDVVVEVGMEYPTRPLLFNPPAVTGQLSTEPAGKITLKNVEIEGVDNYWGTDNPDPEFDTRSIQYAAGYRGSAVGSTTVYEHGVLYKRFTTGETVILKEESIVDGSTITLVAIDGDLSTAQSGPLSVTATSLSGPAQSVSVGPAGGSNIEIELPTELDQPTWETILADELDPDGEIDDAYITDLKVEDDMLTLTMESATNYDLRMAKVGVGNGHSHESAAYITAVSDTRVSMRGGEYVSLKSQVRDQFNNPVVGETVEFTITSGSGKLVAADGTVSAGPVPVKTDENGEASVLFYSYDGAEVESTVDVDGAGTADHEKVRFNLNAEDEIGDLINPFDEGPSGSLILDSSSQNADTFTLTFRNPREQPQTIEGARINFYFTASPGNGNGGGPPPAYATLRDSDDEIIATLKDSDGKVIKNEEGEEISAIVGGQYVSLTSPITIASKTEANPNPTGTMEIEFSGGGYSTSNVDDFFVISLSIDGRSVIYFVADQS